METLELVLGRYDDPEKQIQADYMIDLYRSNMAVFGSAMSGKTTLLKTMLVRIHQMVDKPEKEEIYILDFNNNIGGYGNLPCVRACFNAANDENVRRIFKIVEDKLAMNIRVLAGRNYVQAKDEERPNHITFVLDGLNSFFSEAAYSSYEERLMKLCRDGLSKGISVVFAANEPSGGIRRLLSSFKRVVAFELPSETYSDLFSVRIAKPILMKGRGVANIDTKAYEFHAYYPYNLEEYSGADGEAEALNQFMSLLSDKYTESLISQLEKQKLKSFITDLEVATWEEYTEEDILKEGTLIAGIDYHTFDTVEVSLRNAQAIAIYGKKRWGKSNLLRLLLYGVLGIDGVRLVFLEDGRNGLADVADIYQCFPEIGTSEEKKGFPSYKFFDDAEKMFDFIKNEGYFNIPSDSDVSEEFEDETSGVFQEKENPFTVFVIQSRLFYNVSRGGRGKQLATRLADFVQHAEIKNVLFVFSDVRNIMDADTREYFNNGIRHAFLLDDILRFVNDRGKNSVFGQQDLLDLKENFGKCDVGDGFYFDIEGDHISKFRMIKVSDEKCGNKGGGDCCLWENIMLTLQGKQLEREIERQEEELVTNKKEVERQEEEIEYLARGFTREQLHLKSPDKAHYQKETVKKDEHPEKFVKGNQHVEQTVKTEEQKKVSEYPKTDNYERPSIWCNLSNKKIGLDTLLHEITPVEESKEDVKTGLQPEQKIKQGEELEESVRANQQTEKTVGTEEHVEVPEQKKTDTSESSNSWNSLNDAKIGLMDFFAEI